MKHLTSHNTNKPYTHTQSVLKLIIASVIGLSLQACTSTGINENTTATSTTTTKSLLKNPLASIKSKTTKTQAPTQVPMPVVTISNEVVIKAVMIPTSRYGSEKIDVSKVDQFIEQVRPNARHYPPNFPNNTQRYNAIQHLKKYAKWLQPYADKPDASYELLMRASQINAMARNLDMGSEYAVRGQKYVDQALKTKPDDLEATLYYGIMLSEGGAFKTGRKYLDKAAKLGSVEAQQSIAQSDLLNDKRSESLSRLKKLKENNPMNQQLSQQIDIVNSGKYYIWDLPANDINLSSLD